MAQNGWTQVQNGWLIRHSLEHHLSIYLSIFARYEQYLEQLVVSGIDDFFCHSRRIDRSSIESILLIQNIHK